MDTKKTVMVVDDNPDIITIVRTILEGKGYNVLSAYSGDELFTQLERQKPDLIVLDIMMPQMDGWEVLKLLRVDDETAHVPVAMLSARTEAKDRVQGLQEGAIDYICKPFSLQELLGKIETIFSQVDERGKALR